MTRSAILRGFNTVDSLFDEDATEFVLEVSGTKAVGSFSDYLPLDLELNCYVKDAPYALGFFKRTIEKQRVGRRQYKHHDWGKIYGLMWKHMALEHPDDLTGMQAQLVTLVVESIKSPPADSQLYMAASRVLEQYGGSVAGELLHKTRLPTKKRSPR